LNSWERGLVEELQHARTDPKSYARILEEQRKPKYKGLELHYRGERRRDDLIIDTREGVGACQEAIQFLKNVQPLPRLRLSVGLCLAAKKSVNTVGPQGSTDANSTAHVSEFGRLEPSGTTAEVAAFGTQSLRDMVFNLLICDGDTSRQGRKDIFDDKWTVMGVAAGRHARKDKMAIINFATQYTDKQAVLQKPLESRHKHMWQVNEP